MTTDRSQNRSEERLEKNILLLFLTPLFHRPISEKHPYGFYQIESFFILAKGIMMTSVTFSVLASVVEKLFSGGNPVNKGQVSLFQLVLGLVSLLILCIMKVMSRTISSPTVDAEILGWKMDVGYSLGMSVAFFAATYLQNTPLAFLSPYFDQIIALLVMIFMLPETVRMLLNTCRELFLFSPDQETVDRIKELSGAVLCDYPFTPVFYDISRTGRRLWIAVYFQSESDCISVRDVQEATDRLNRQIAREFPDAACELILDNHPSEILRTDPEGQMA